MSRFYSEITCRSPQSSSVKTTGRGSRNSIISHTRGYSLGVHVEIFVDLNGNDCIEIYKTKGSDDPSGVLIATFIEPNSSGPRDRSGRLK